MLIGTNCPAIKLLFLLFLTAPSVWSQAIRTRAENEHFPSDSSADYRNASQAALAVDSDVAFLDNEETIRLDSSGNAFRTQYFRYKVLTAKGAERWSSISTAWRPWSGHRPRIRARVITSDGVIHELDEKTISDSPAQAQDSNLYSDVRVLRAPLPAIAAGCVVEEELVSDESAPFEGTGVLQRYYLSASIPIQHTRITVEIPTDLPFHYDVRLMPDLKPIRTEENGHLRLVFEHGPIPPVEDKEPDTPFEDAIYPSLTIGAGTSWQNLAAKYGEIVNRQIAAPLPVGLFETNNLRDQQISSILKFIDQQVRYTGVEFGDANVAPRTPSEVLKRKYGDCKDKAALLIAMLRSVKIPAYMALLRVGDREDLSAELAGMGMFDHAIVYIPGKKDIWIDATDDHAKMDDLPIGDQGRLALIVRPDSNRLVRTPVAPSADNLLFERREIYLSDYGKARIVEISQPHGSEESNYRRQYSNPKDKNTQESIAAYLKNEYLADVVDQIERTDPDDLSIPFELTLKSGKARRGNTDLDSAVAAIRFEGIFDRLPTELRERRIDFEETTSKQIERRTHDYQLPEAFVTEWRYTIIPPFGFSPKPLPKDSEISLGPSQLVQKFQADKDGVVHVTLRFDTVKRRMTPDEGEALRHKAVEMMEGTPILIYFEPIALTLKAQGNLREADRSYRDLIAKHPDQAVHRIRLAKMLLSAGLGEAARKEARTAAQIEPNSLMTQKELAKILEHDLVGRKFRVGSDYQGAESALRAALMIDPKDEDTILELAMLLERNKWGLKNGVGARIKEAIKQYQTLKPEKLNEDGHQNNLPYALFYDGRFAESKRIAEQSNSPSSLIVADEAAMNGPEAGLVEARKRGSGEEQSKQSANIAGDLLADIQMYTLAAALKDAGAYGDQVSETAAYAALYRKAQPHQKMIFGDDPASVAMRFQLISQDPELTVSQLASICSKNGKVGLATAKEVERLTRLEKELLFHKALQEDRPEVGLDVAMARAQPKASGTDATGYKVIMFPGGKNRRTRFVVRENGQYKLLGTTETPSAIGLEVLDRISANDLEGAQWLLNTFRDELPLQNGDDPLSGWPFSRFWTRGRSADPSMMKVAAALLLLPKHEEFAPRAIEILQQSRMLTTRDADKTNILLGLEYSYQLLNDHVEALEIARLLVNEYPESEEAFQLEAHELLQLNKYAEAERAADDRLKRIPDDLEAMRIHLEAAMGREDYSSARDWSMKLLNNQRAISIDLNSVAWDALFTGKISPADIDQALNALQLNQDDPSTMHTLACLYSEQGNASKAAEILARSMDLLNMAEPNPDYWYAFGRIAELYGERDEAISSYKRVKVPEQPAEIPTSTYKLAQIRLRVLNSQGN